jgi:RimJ/RimL family protein N-acetyltransferase
MRKYKVLNKNIFSKGIFKIIPIRFEDRFDIMNWRNEQMYHLRQNSRLSEEDQDYYFHKVVYPLFSKEKPKQLLFSYLKNEKLIGYGGLVHINWVERTAEVSFIMKTSLERDEFDLHWSSYLTLIKKIAFEELKFQNIYTYAYDLRTFLYPTLEKNNFKLKMHLKDEIEIDKKKIDVFIHECINPVSFLKVREVTENDSELIFNWSNDPLVRSQSFKSNKIEFKNHENWLKEKLKNDNSLLLINQFKSNNIGLVKFEVEKENCTVGLLLDKKYRGQGLSSLMLRISSAFYFHRFLIPISAYIKESNIASIKSFEKAGYKFFNNTKVNGFNTLVYKLEKL